MAYNPDQIVELDRTGVFGWAWLPGDLLYDVTIGVYLRDRLIACAVADLPRPARFTEGPQHSWFYITWADWQVKLSDNDMEQLSILRCEDMKTIFLAPRLKQSAGVMTVEDILACGGGAIQSDGSNSVTLHFLSAGAIVELLYLDLLGRTVDYPAYMEFSTSLQKGDITLNSLRKRIIKSDEFRMRGIRISDALATSALLCAPLLVNQNSFITGTPLYSFSEVDREKLNVDEDNDEAFLKAVYQYVLQSTLDEGGRSFFMNQLASGIMSRIDVIRDIVKSAALRGQRVLIR